MATVYKNIKMCLNSARDSKGVAIDFSPYDANWWVNDNEVTTSIGLIMINKTINAIHGVVGLVIIAPIVFEGTITIRVRSGGPVGEIIDNFVINLTVSAECITEELTCCKGVNIRWLSVAGGIKEWPFPGVREFDIRNGDALSFKNDLLETAYSERKDVYQGKSASSGDITKAQYDFITELRSAIQAWEYDQDTEIATPIKIDNDSFIMYPSNAKFYEMSFRYIMSAEARIQTQ